jgi:uncharacterized protein (TIGR00661 family)
MLSAQTVQRGWEREVRPVNIAVSINGQGRGHLTRMTALSQLLAKEHNISFWCPEKYHDFLKAHFPDNLLFSIPYYHFVLEGGKIDILKTGVSNAAHLIGSASAVDEIADQLRLLDIDVLISDFEPFVPKAAHKLNVPVIQLNHPGVVQRSPGISPEILLAKMISTTMMGEYDVKIISSFYNGDVGPIIRPALRNARPSRGNYYVVYVYPTVIEEVVDILERIGGIEYRVFPNPEEDFVDSLIHCRGVITNAGHQLLSESLHLEKPILSIPFERQFEQKLNAEMLSLTGRGITGTMKTLGKDLEAYLRFSENFVPDQAFPLGIQGFRLRDDSVRAAALLNHHIFRLAQRVTGKVAI